MNKKYLGMVGLGCGLLLLTGCGGNKLTCTMSEEEEGVASSEAEVVIHYDSDWKKIESIDMEMSIEVEDDEMLEMYEGFFGGMCEMDEAPKECDVKTKGNKITLSASGDAKEMDYEQDTSKEDLIEQLENEGYTCK